MRCARKSSILNSTTPSWLLGAIALLLSLAVGRAQTPDVDEKQSASELRRLLHDYNFEIENFDQLSRRDGWSIAEEFPKVIEPEDLEALLSRYPTAEITEDVEQMWAKKCREWTAQGKKHRTFNRRVYAGKLQYLKEQCIEERNRVAAELDAAVNEPAATKPRDRNPLVSSNGADAAAHNEAYKEFEADRVKDWAAAKLQQGVLTGEEMKFLLANFGDAAEGKSILLKDYVSSVSGDGSLSKDAGTTANIRLRSGLSMKENFADRADGRRTKLRINSGSVEIHAARSLESGRWKNFTLQEVLFKQGQEIYVRGVIEGGRFNALGLATSQEITEAQLRSAGNVSGQSFQDALTAEKLRIRIGFLEAQLSGNAGSAMVSGVAGTTPYSGTVVYQHSDAERAAMRRELELLRAQIAAQSGL